MTTAISVLYTSARESVNTQGRVTLITFFSLQFFLFLFFYFFLIFIKIYSKNATHLYFSCSKTENK